MKLLKIFFTLLRYRVALMLLIFFLFGVVKHSDSLNFSIEYLLAGLALCFSYIAATSINDTVDFKVDRVNHPRSIDRPLVSGQANKNQMISIHILASSLAIICGFLISTQALLIILLSLSINFIYSVQPFQISYKTYFAPFLLSIAYVFVPYWFGVEVSNSDLGKSDILFVTSLIFLFLGRIILKDFRDREGDRKFGKPTFVLRHGKRVTIILSYLFVISGNVMLFISISLSHISYALILQFFFIGIYFLMYRLLQAEDIKQELLTIGMGAKIANGLLLTVMGIFVLQLYKAPINDILFFTFMMTVFYVILFRAMAADLGAEVRK